jgi:hypothetical protein
MSLRITRSHAAKHQEEIDNNLQNAGLDLNKQNFNFRGVAKKTSQVAQAATSLTSEEQAMMAMLSNFSIVKGVKPGSKRRQVNQFQPPQVPLQPDASPPAVAKNESLAIVPYRSLEDHLRQSRYEQAHPELKPLGKDAFSMDAQGNILPQVKLNNPQVNPQIQPAVVQAEAPAISLTAAFATLEKPKVKETLFERIRSSFSKAMHSFVDFLRNLFSFNYFKGKKVEQIK